jgi:hypothetical protein
LKHRTQLETAVSLVGNKLLFFLGGRSLAELVVDLEYMNMEIPVFAVICLAYVIALKTLVSENKDKICGSIYDQCL